ncbi:serine/threonine-protein kinase HAL4/sat4, partial [Serendipita sp. 407]
MPTPNVKVSNATKTTAVAGGQPTGEEDAGGGESEPANDSNKATLKTDQPTPERAEALQIPQDKAKFLQQKSPKSPNRPHISVEITPATPKLTQAAVPTSPKSARKVSQRTPASAVNGPSSPHEAIQSWVQSQDSGNDPSVSSPSKQQEQSKRDSTSAMPTSAIRSRRPSESSQKSIPRPPSATGSHSGGEGRFSLKDLLSSGPKLTRRNSASSKKSVSSGKAGSVKGGSTAGESAALESKYGIYGKMAVGKGATSVVRLAHRWDRTEDKLYAVK